jgi:F-type H+-transporting ATPase subunit delta
VTAANIPLSAVSIPLAGEEAILARRYVGALYDLAEQEKTVDAVATEIRGLRRLWDESAEWRFVATDPRLDAAQLRKAAEEVVSQTGMGKLTGNFLSVVAQNRRLFLLPAIIEGFLALVATRRGESQADVRTAHALTAAQKEALASSLQQVIGGKVNLTIVEDASLIGGLTVKMGSQFIDASVKTKLDQLERTLKGAA